MSDPTARPARCPHCGTILDVPELWLSATIVCPECFTTIPLTTTPATGRLGALPTRAPGVPPRPQATPASEAAPWVVGANVAGPAEDLEQTRPLAAPALGASAPDMRIEERTGRLARSMAPADDDDPAETPLPRGIPLEVGLEGALNGAPYRVVARVGLRDDTEAWDEWLLMTPAGEGHWLSDSQARGLVLWSPAPPPQRFDPATVARGSVLRLAGGHARVRARGSAQIDHLEAEPDLPWAATPGDRLDYADAIGPHGLHTVQWIGEQIECFHGRALRREDVERAFGLASGPDWLERAYL